MNLELYDAAQKSAVWRDLSHFGRFNCRGKDAAALLHHLTTNDIKGLKSGTTTEAALVTSKARVLDWLTVARVAEGFLVVASPNRRAMFTPHARKFVLFRQEISIDDVTEQGAMIGIFGAQAAGVAAKWGLEALWSSPSTVAFGEFQEVALNAVRTHRLPREGFFVWSDDGVGLRKLAAELGQAVDDTTYNVLRVEAGVPVTGLELTEEINPWEAGLDSYISLHKGCYNGQEIVARLNTYQKVKQNLRGLKLENAIVPGIVATLQSDEGRNAGFITSSVESPRFGPLALGYVRNDFQESGQKLRIVADGVEQTTTVTTLPFGDAA